MSNGRFKDAFIRLFERNEERIAQNEFNLRVIAMYERKVMEQAAEIIRLRTILKRSTTPDRSLDNAPWDEQ